jgi:cell division protein FtsI (penicillin-binding protein 3)
MGVCSVVWASVRRRVPVSGRGLGTAACAQHLAADRAGDDVLWLRHFGVAAAAGALYTIFASDGVLYPVTLLKRDGPAQGTRVISAQTALAVRQMLELAAQPGGTAPGAQVSGYTVAGKTGTAHKFEGRGYAPTAMCRPLSAWRLHLSRGMIIAVMIDEPSAGQHYGGAVAAPVFSQVAAGTLRFLAVPPDAPGKTTMLAPEDAPLVREEV